MGVGLREDRVGLRAARGEEFVGRGEDGGGGLELWGRRDGVEAVVGRGEFSGELAEVVCVEGREQRVGAYGAVENIKKGDESVTAAAPEARRLAAVIEERIVKIVYLLLQARSRMSKL